MTDRSDDDDDDLKGSLANPKPVKRKRAKKDKPPEEQKAAPRWIETDPPIMPEDCPVIMLGRDRRRYGCIDSNGQLVDIEVNQLSSDGLADLFASPKAFAWLWKSFPKFNKEGVQNGWDKERAKIAFMQGCAHKGPFNFDQRVRGEGAWKDDAGRLTWHLGDRVLVVEEDKPPVWETSPLVNGYVYPRGSKMPSPAEKREPEGHAIKAVFALLQKWHWSRAADPDTADLDARMVLGWIGCAIIAGALGWRPAMWLRGPRGAGKSTLQLIIKYLLGGDGASLQASDASAAGIYTALQKRSIPVLVDEAEPKAGDNRHVENVISLARASASGSSILRSGQDLKSREFYIRAAFLFASINVPSLEVSDMTRLVQLRLLPAQKGSGDLAWDPEQLLEAGRQIRKILVDAWDIWPKLLSAWRNEFMGPHELEPRIADTWGSVLAMSDLILNAEQRIADRGPDPEEIRRRTKPIADEVREMLSEQGSDHDKVIEHFMSSKIEPWARGVKWTVETLIMVAANWPIPGDIASQIPDEMKPERANSGLIANGFRVVKATRPKRKEDIEEPTEQLYLACHKNHRGAKEIFEDTALKNNGHLQQLQQVPGAYSSRQRFAGNKRHPCIMVPLRYLLEESGSTAGPRPTPQPMDPPANGSPADDGLLEPE